MPSRNTLKIDLSDSYYHIYSRGHSRTKIFLEDSDYKYFIKLFQRYLSKAPTQNKQGTVYPHLYNKLELLCYCLMENHFHLLIYQKDEGAMTLLMRGIMASYSRYFNQKYNKSGALFESRYKASMINEQSYLEHISRYIHLNRKQWQDSEYSSIKYYLTNQKVDWLKPNKILGLYNNREEYLQFVADYQENQNMLDELKYELANDITS